VHSEDPPFDDPLLEDLTLLLLSGVIAGVIGGTEVRTGGGIEAGLITGLLRKAANRGVREREIVCCSLLTFWASNSLCYISFNVMSLLVSPASMIKLSSSMSLFRASVISSIVPGVSVECTTGAVVDVEMIIDSAVVNITPWLAMVKGYIAG